MASHSPLNISETVRDRLSGYCQLSLSAHIAAVCRLSKCLLPAAPATAGCPVIVWRCKSNIGPGVRFLSPGLLQLSVLRHLGRTDESVAVGSERRRRSGYWYSTFIDRLCSVQLHWLPVRQSVDFKVATVAGSSVAVWHAKEADLSYNRFRRLETFLFG